MSLAGTPELINPSDYILQKVELVADRFETSVDLTSSTIEVNVFESIDKLFLTGSLVFLDDNGIAQYINFSGTEKITIEVKLPAQDSVTFSKTFIVTSVDSQVKSNDSATVIALSLIEESGFLSQIKKFSKTYNGTAEQILAKICKDQLGKELIVVGKSIQENFRVIVPYMTVEQSLQWVLNKASTTNGSPFFLFSTFQSDDYYLVNLDSILKDEPANKGLPFIYSSAYVNKPELSIANKSRNIQSLRMPYQDDTLNFAKMGYFGSDYSITKLDANKSENYHHSIVDVYNKLGSEDILDTTQTKAIVDDNFNLNDRRLQSYNSKFFHQLSFSTFEDKKNYYEEQDFSVTKNRLFSKTLLNLMHKSSIEINVPGLLFLLEKVLGVGVNIDVSILSNDVNKENGSPLEDKKYSGTYMIFNKRHLFSFRGGVPLHTVALKLCRLTMRQ